MWHRQLRRGDGVVRLGELDRAGKYEGTLSVDPDDPKAAAITLTANVQDFFIWPLAAVLIGEGLAFGVAYWRDRRRAREILEAGLTKAKQEFDDALLTGELTERERSWFDGVLEPPGTSRAAVTLAQIRKAPSKEDLNSQAKDSGEVVAIWESLSKLRNAVASLKEQLDKN